MYSVDEKDAISPLPDVPQSSTGAPLPAILADEQRLLLAYLLGRHDPDWDGTSVTMVGADDADRAIAIVDFAHPLMHMFGPPNDEAFRGHPLADRGLRPYSAFAGSIAVASPIRIQLTLRASPAPTSASRL